MKKPKDRQTRMRIVQQMADRKETLEQLILDMERREMLNSLIDPFKEEYNRLSKNLREFRRVEARG